MLHKSDNENLQDFILSIKYDYAILFSISRK